MATTTVLTTESPDRWKYLNNILTRRGPYSDETFEPGDEPKAFLADLKILVIGAGGLGCEILKNLALSGFKDIHVIDMDTIDISNLNRQFLFREADVGKSKAEVAAAFVMKRVRGVKITPFNCAIQDKDDEYYKQFKIVVCGLDSVEARRWINATLVNLVGEETLIPLIDGGTEGFKGQARVILPTISCCYECTLDMLTPRAAVPLCTLASIPRQPAHCIEWASVIQWPKEKGDLKIDMDDPEHVTWLYTKALGRAKEFNIPGVTYAMTQGVIKNIIPAIASTNAIVAASCCSEALKIATTASPYLDNYMMYTGDESVYTYTFQHEKKDDCPVCGNLPQALTVDPESTLEQLMEKLQERPETTLKKPSLRTSAKSLYLQAPKQLEEQTRPNLEKQLKELMEEGDELSISDPGMPFNLRFIISFSS
ncbi:hypothetical protein TWF569_006616 [Orbilia oligospora]|uniref:NEDD8-activating enzyme E1 catalytic subunit n=1 Tax=Orbilia oligospora TaxID=2813651 RepID=A0A7C8JFG0_ORBOL|nr:hypothetical protein TWF103_003271 [Orbilia oligospora]KAF3087424.1 hypothetical protein TWF102_010495 [Orbilia oligospora]KAF3102248.1 hypothetical protein TWF706_005393 [Orbilia oligospora]KAF3120231.1 hypothetical protein TWF703_002689 [Orbilia oligospora]KAF3124021.1 hypothetical protein TWF594_002133 [Orbilia oligospora]